MKSKKLLTVVMSIASLAMVGCTRTAASDTPASNTPASNEGSTSNSSKPAEKVTLNMSVYYDNNDRHMKFIEGAAAKLPYSAADGNNYRAGGFKPVWKAIQKNLNFVINDVSPTGKVAIKDTFSSLSTTDFKLNDVSVDIAQGNSDQILNTGTTTGKILDLKPYLSKMPNFNKFLTDNPAVKKTITSNKGKIFYAPYFDGFDDLERMIMVRQDWVEKLLDGDLPTTLDTTTLNKNYQPFYTKNINSDIDVLNAAGTGKETVKKVVAADNNVIKKQNSLPSLTGKSAVETLRSYIDATYKKADGTYIFGTKRSELFVGGRAIYDIDELVALFRCVKGNAKFLTGKEVNVIPFFPRAKTSDRTTDLYRFLQFFGVRGTESRNQWLYVGKDGKLVDTRGTEEFATGLEKLHEMYQDGLIMQDFTDQLDQKDDFRGPFLSGGDTAKNFGFATYDYNQTTTIYNDTTKDKTMKLVSLLPAVADWDDGKEGNFIHYTESWRSVKPQGWFITSQTAKNPAKLDKALELFDYLYSEKGNRLMSYGPDEYLAKNADGSIKTMDYQGKQVPILSDACKKEMKDLCGGNYTNYYRYYLGATLPVGYVKEQGMEYQTVSAKATDSLNTLNHAIQYGVLQHVNHKADNTNHMNDIVPTTLPFTEAENTQLQNFTELNTAFTSNKKEIMTISKIVINGWSTQDNLDFSSKTNYLNTVNTTLKLKEFVTLYNDAYTLYKTF